jgi:hypothetical protein
MSSKVNNWNPNRNRSSDFDIEIEIPILTSKSKFRFWHRNRNFEKSKHSNFDEIRIKFRRNFDFLESNKMTFVKILVNPFRGIKKLVLHYIKQKPFRGIKKLVLHQTKTSPYLNWLIPGIGRIRICNFWTRIFGSESVKKFTDPKHSFRLWLTSK